MLENRQLNWDGCINVRDLGGLPTRDGRVTHWGAVVRSDTPARLTAAGWSALYDCGIRTIITLRTDGMAEDALNVTPPYADLVTVQVAIEDVTDMEFARQWASTDFWGTPLYYKDALQLWPERHAAAIAAIAQAQPGGVLFHCIRGYDRTGIIALLLLALVGVTPEDILIDYEMSVDPYREELLNGVHTSTREVILDTLVSLDAENYLLAGGLSRSDLEVVRARLLGPTSKGEQSL
ncbi:MAG: tyrosine-protein phosphatase [Anaerolineae bacterium]|nr:tyrosine-protein phosphatase [Anaerolineae bacterium]